MFYSVNSWRKWNEECNANGRTHASIAKTFAGLYSRSQFYAATSKFFLGYPFKAFRWSLRWRRESNIPLTDGLKFAFTYPNRCIDTSFYGHVQPVSPYSPVARV